MRLSVLGIITRWRQRLVEHCQQLSDRSAYFAGQRAALIEIHRMCPRPDAPHLKLDAGVYSHVLREHAAGIGDIFAQAVKGSP